MTTATSNQRLIVLLRHGETELITETMKADIEACLASFTAGLRRWCDDVLDRLAAQARVDIELARGELEGVT